MTIKINTVAPLASTAPLNVTKAAASAGSSQELARSDHKHDISTASAATVGTVNSEGSATSLARSDHTHQVTGLSIASQAQGDVLYYNGSSWVRLAAGTSGNFLQTQGGGANPLWATAAVAGGTLDQSYDSGGAGAGRTITVDAGTVLGQMLLSSPSSTSPSVSATNNTAATVGVQLQNSPAVLLAGKGWAASASVAADITMLSSGLGLGSTPNHRSVLNVYGNTNGGTAALAASWGQQVLSGGIGSAAAPAFSNTTSTNTGFYFPVSTSAAISTNGTAAVQWGVSLQTLMSSGSAGTPSISFSTGATTGFYSPSANQVAISTSGSICMHWVGSQTRAPNGSASLPAYGFINSSTTGFYYTATNLMSLSLAGSIAMTWTTNTTRAKDGSASLPAYGFINSSTTGMYSPAASQVAIATAGSLAMKWAGGQALAASGSVGTPSYAFTNSATTGFYSPATGQIAISIAGTQRWSMSSSMITATTNLYAGSAGLKLGSAQGWSAIYQNKNSIGTGTDITTAGLHITNSATASLGNSKFSAALELTGDSWGVSPGNRKTVSWGIQCQPYQSTVIQGNMTFLRSIAGASHTYAGAFIYQSTGSNQLEFNISGDIDAEGGFRQTRTCGATPTAIATYTCKWFNVTGTAYDNFMMIRAGSVVGMTVRSSTVLTGNHQIGIKVRKSTNGGGSHSDLWNPGVLMVGSMYNGGTDANKDTHTFNAGDYLDVQITTYGTSWVTRSVAVGLILEY